MSEQTMRKLAKPMLFMAAFIWGSSFFIMKDALDQMPVQYLLAIRFTIGAVLLGLVCGKKWRRCTRDYVWRGAVMATTVALLFQNVGQVWSDPASASVILSLESVFGVLCSVLFAGDQVSGRMLLGFALIFVAVVCSETKLRFLRRNG